MSRQKTIKLYFAAAAAKLCEAFGENWGLSIKGKL